MKNIKGLAGLLAFVGCLWAVVVTTYGAQVRNEAFDGKQTTMMPLQDSSCSSSSSSSGGE
jgi:cbb3-type cytochrome oxidase subunit 3